MFQLKKISLMQQKALETDYLTIGAVGIAFADTLLTAADASILIVDKHHKLGGHWNNAYSFVTQHQPSAFYGVNSNELSTAKCDQIGLNRGLHELASGSQVLSYFDHVMRHTFLPSGRVQYSPMCEHQGHHSFSSVVTYQHYAIKVKCKIIDYSYFKTSVPPTHKTDFKIQDGGNFMLINDLPKLSKKYSNHLLIGGGKISIDAYLWLLEKPSLPTQISCRMPRDAWWIDCRKTQPGRDCFASSIGAQLKKLEATACADSLKSLFGMLEDAGVLIRFDSNITPKMFHGATTSLKEAEQLHRVNNVIGRGRVRKLGLSQIEFDDITISTNHKALHIDCSVRTIPVTQPKTVFNSETITVQTAPSYQPVFIAHTTSKLRRRITKERTLLSRTAAQSRRRLADWSHRTNAKSISQATRFKLTSMAN